MASNPNGERYLDKEAWAKESAGLPEVSRNETDMFDVVIAIEAIGPEYFTNDSVQHCILERVLSARYVAPYDCRGEEGIGAFR